MDITAYLDHPLDPACRVIHMTGLADRVAARPAPAVFDDLLGVLGARPLSGEDLRRLHVLLSQLHHAHPTTVDGRLDAELRDLVSTVWQLAHTQEEGGDPHVVPEPGLSKGRLLNRPQAAPHPA